MPHHRSRRAGFALTLASALLIPVLSAGAQTPADNTKVNKPQPVVLYELMKGWLTGTEPEVGKMHTLKP